MAIGKLAVCEQIAASLREFGYPSVTAEMISECLDAWIAKKEPLPHGVIGMFAQRQFAEIEEERPGALAVLK